MATTYKLLLLQPPIQDFYDTAIRLQPVGLGYLKAAVQKFLPEVRVIIKDYHQGWGRRTIPLPPELAYLQAYYAAPDKSPFSAFYQYYHFGAPFVDIAQGVAAEQPDLVGISALFSPYYREALRCAQALKQQINVPIIVGGSHVSADPAGMLQPEWIDYVVRGEGERPLVEFLQAWLLQSGYAHVPNLGFKHDGKMILNPLAPNYPLDDLPPPDFADFPLTRYQFEQRPLCVLLTSRGCPYHCSFCAVQLTFGPTYRKRSAALIFQEILQRYAEGYRVFDFEDDNLTFDAEEMTRLCEKIMAHFPAGELQLLAMNGLSYLDLDRDLLALMKRAGFSHLNLSLVSADPETRQRLNRPHALDHYLDIVHAGAQLQFQMVAYQILGLPQESLDAMIYTLVLNAGLPVLIGASIFYLTPNSPIAKDFPPRTDTDLLTSRSTAMAIETPQCTRDDLFTLFLTARIINFLKGLTLPESSTPLSHALRDAEHQGGRTALGVAVFRKLFEDHTLYAVTGKAWQRIQRFRPDLFFRVWSRLQRICTQEGKFIACGG